MCILSFKCKLVHSCSKFYFFQKYDPGNVCALLLLCRGVNLFEDRCFQMGHHIFRIEHFSSENIFFFTYLPGSKTMPWLFKMHFILLIKICHPPYFSFLLLQTIVEEKSSPKGILMVYRNVIEFDKL